MNTPLIQNPIQDHAARSRQRLIQTKIKPPRWMDWLGNIAVITGLWIACLIALGVIARAGCYFFMLGWKLI